MKTVLILALLSLASVAHADEWFHANLRSAEGISITLDYQKRHIEEGGANSRGVLSPLWISVGGLSPSDTVTARLMNFDANRGNWVENRDITLHFEGGRFTGEFQEMPFYRFRCGSPVYSNGREYCQRGSDTMYPYRQELNIQVNGRYLVDPMNRSHNFQIDM